MDIEVGMVGGWLLGGRGRNGCRMKDGFDRGVADPGE